MALNCEVTLDLDTEDVAAILTKEFCDTYTAFSNLRVECLTMMDDDKTLRLTMSPKPKEPEQSA